MGWRSYPLEELKAPVSADRLRAFLAYPAFTSDETDLAEAFVKSATASISDHLQRELYPRKRKLEVWSWPTYGTRATWLSESLETAARGVTLPYGPVVSVESVLVDGEAFSDHELDGDLLVMDASDDVVVEYTAGYDNTKFFMPDQIKEAILTLAAWRWHNRGESAADALEQSGALESLQPLKVPML